MPVGYVVANLEDVIKGRVEQYINSLKMLREAVRSEAERYLEALSFGGLTPEENQYAEVPPRPEMFTGVAGTVLKDSFRQNFTSTGWQKILSADLSDAGELKKKYVMGIAGIAILDPVSRISQIQMVAGDYTHPVIDIEEVVVKPPVAIIFDISDSNVEKFVFNPDKKFELYADLISTGYQGVKPLGIAEVPKPTAIEQTIS